MRILSRPSVRTRFSSNRPGSVLTTIALTYASIQLRKGNRDKFQSALRWRVGFQAITVAAAAASLFYLKRPKSRVPPPGPDGKPQKLEPWNPEKAEARERASDDEHRARISHAQSRDAREDSAVRRMIEEAIKKREAEEAAAAEAKKKEAAAATPSPDAQPVDETVRERVHRLIPRLGQEKRSWTFTQS